MPVTPSVWKSVDLEFTCILQARWYPSRMSTSETEPRLAPPGAGIPAIERFVGSLVLAVKRWFYTRERVGAEFDQERKAIARLYHGRDERALEKRVLVPRLRGLEDSSRFWSVCMTLDHLRIVNEQIARVIAELTQGRVPQRKASTAAVKPSVDSGSSVIAAYETSCDDLIAVVAASPELRTPVKFDHPWFGPLNAAGWHTIAAIHMGIHRAQMIRILGKTKTQSL